MTAERIEFSLVHGTEDSFPRPYPAAKEIPEWYKAMPIETEADGMKGGTLKNCPPFLEAMTCGYIIPLCADISLSVDKAGVFHGEGPTLQEQNRFAHVVTAHLPSQAQGAPFQNNPLVKILNPWLIRTPPGYSTLFLPALNRFHMPLFPLAGLVETDLFYREVHFPSILLIPPGMTLRLHRGTALVQAIPIKRDEFQSEFVPLDAEQYKTGRAQTLPDEHGLYPERHNFYKNNYWRKKNYR